MKFIKLFSVSLCGVLFANMANAADLAREIANLREDVTVLQRQMYREDDKKASANGDVQSKIGEYDEAIRKLNGRLDELEHQLKSNDEKIERYNRDMEIRLKILEGKPIPDSLSAPAPRFPTIYNAPVAQDAAAAVAGDEIKGKDLEPLETEKNKPAAKPAPTPAPAPAPAAATSKPNPKPAPAATPTAANDAKTIYDKAMKAYNAGSYDEAEKGYEDILERFPNHALASNAQYWLGEVYLKRGKYGDAKVAFKDGYDNYKNGNKGADSLYRLATTFVLLDDNHRACLVLMNFDDEFPKANAELKSKVNVEKIKLNCKEVLHGYR